MSHRIIPPSQKERNKYRAAEAAGLLERVLEVGWAGLSAKERAEMSAAAYRMWQDKCDARTNAERFTEMLRSL